MDWKGISTLMKSLKNIGVKVNIYSDRDKAIWDEFVQSSKNGTFLFYRDFLDYHSDRFSDFSLLFYEDDKLLALLPANQDGGVLYSHHGLTYGGLIMNEETKTSQVVEIFDCLSEFLKDRGFVEMIYKPVPHIYHQIPAEEDLYALYLHKAELVGRGISSAILLSEDAIAYSSSRVSGLKKADRAGLYVEESLDFPAFWDILSENLRKRFALDPVHKLHEIRMLRNRFPENIKLYGVFTPDQFMIGGELVFISDNVVHAQYTAATEEGKKNGAVDLAIDYIINDARERGKRYFDYGISTENNGLYLNEGLVSQKEGFGARGVVYDIYSIKLR